MIACTKDHADVPGAFSQLPESQAKRWRHICAACAYDLGRVDAAKAESNLRERVRALTSQVEQLKQELAATVASAMRAVR
jgi:hypothetical protein